MDEATVKRSVSAQKVRRLDLEVHQGPDTGRTHRTSHERVTVGFSEDNDLVLTDPTVSRYHLELRRDQGGVAVKDLGSSNGTYLGATRLRDAIVPVGSRLVLGGTVLALEARDEDEEAAPLASLAVLPVPGLVAASRRMQDVVRAIHALADKPTSVHIEGETGTGKELVASALHRLGPRRDAPFEVVDCGAMPAPLIASELFGHERGAFTGADRRYAGAFERAHGGTLFLDEVGELPLELQPALLGALQRRRFRPVGAEREVSVDVRVVSATNRDLRAEVNRGTFRADLYFRLAAVRVVLPPLRERPDDVEPLVRYFVAELTGAPEPLPFDAAGLEALRGRAWTGNVRELQNVVEAAIVAPSLDRDPAAAPSPSAPPTQLTYGAPAQPPLPYREARRQVVQRFERDYLQSLMEAAGQNASEAARRAKMDRPYLLSLLRRHGLR